MCSREELLRQLIEEASVLTDEEVEEVLEYAKREFEAAVEEGKKADVILLNIDQPHLTPTQNLINTVVEAANGHDVTDSIINGRIVMKNREVLTLDEE